MGFVRLPSRGRCEVQVLARTRTGPKKVVEVECKDVQKPNSGIDADEAQAVFNHKHYLATH